MPAPLVSRMISSWPSLAPQTSPVNKDVCCWLHASFRQLRLHPALGGGGAITIRRMGRWKITLPLIWCLQFTLRRRISVSEFCPLHPTRSLASDCVCTPCVFCMNSYQRFIQYLYI
jgi:hypothetical protein